MKDHMKPGIYIGCHLSVANGYEAMGKTKVGVCFDTCHTWDAGYDLVNDLDKVLTHFDRVIGLEKLYAVHFNDSKNECGSHKDRHEKLGQGKLGLEAMKRIALHPALAGRPFILETPNDDEGYIREIHTVLEWMRASSPKAG